MANYFVTSIGTDCGKTICAAVLCAYLGADYYKPIQTGAMDSVDAHTVLELVSIPNVVIYPSQIIMDLPLSPHAAQIIENRKEINIKDITLPKTNNKNLIVEGAGGILVPLNLHNDFVIDVATHLNLEVILIIKHYLGSINHSLLTIHYLKNNGIKVKGIIYNGEKNELSEKAIEQSCPYPILGRIPLINPLTPDNLMEMVKKLSLTL